VTSRWARWSPLAGVLAVAAMVIAFGISGDAPMSDDTDATITSYWASNSHQARNIATFFVFLAGILFLLLFLSALRTRLVHAEGQPGRASALAYGAGVASSALLFSGASFFVAPAFVAEDTDKFNLDANTFRILNDLGYELWVGGVVVAALVVWATSTVALRTKALPRWFGWLGILVGIILLFAVFFFPVFVYWAWILVAAILLAWRPTTMTAQPVPAET
jgi:Domain of unknown function (DUF4386)